MASLITHPIVPIAVAAIVGRKFVPVPLIMAGVFFSVLPDLDGITFRLGIPYASDYGHRGFSHSILLALLLSAVMIPFAGGLKTTGPRVFSFLSISMLSHGVLDAFTNNGHGVAFLWPFSNERIFFAFRPLETSPVSIQRFLSERGLEVLQSELLWVWLPLFLVSVVSYGMRKSLPLMRSVAVKE